MNRSIGEVEQEVVSEFEMLPEWMDKYEYIIDLGKSMPVIDEAKKQSFNLIKGCQSRVWLDATGRDGKIYFTADSDAIITKGIISLLIKIYNGRTPEEILSSDFSFIDKIGLRENLTPTRANGLVSMIEQIKDYALMMKS